MTEYFMAKDIALTFSDINKALHQDDGKRDD